MLFLWTNKAFSVKSCSCWQPVAYIAFLQCIHSIRMDLVWNWLHCLMVQSREDFHYKAGTIFILLFSHPSLKQAEGGTGKTETKRPSGKCGQNCKKHKMPHAGTFNSKYNVTTKTYMIHIVCYDSRQKMGSSVWKLNNAFDLSSCISAAAHIHQVKDNLAKTSQQLIPAAFTNTWGKPVGSSRIQVCWLGMARVYPPCQYIR